MNSKLFILLLLPSIILGQTLAFPDAPGHGRFASGGRGGIVVEVTNLNNSGAGSLRAAIDQTGARTIIFRVGGIIDITSSLVIDNNEGNVTIAGETAPGDGILIRGEELEVNASNVIIRHIRIRPGDGSATNHDGLAIRSRSGNHISDIIADHVSVSWAFDECLNLGAIGAFPGTGGSVSDVTVSNGIFSENIGTAYNTLLWQNVLNLSLYQNLFTKSNTRNIRSSTANARFEMINNWIYRYTAGTQFTYENWADIIGNEWDLAGQSLQGGFTVKVNSCSSTNCPDGTTNSLTKTYVSDNEFNGASGIESEVSSTYNTGSRNLPSNITPYSVSSVKTNVYANAGAYNGLAQGLDAIDQEYLDNANDDTQDALRTSAPDGIYPTISNGTPYTDSDGDGMEDSWETSEFGDLDQTNNTDFDSDGWTDLEEFLHYRAGDSPGSPTGDFPVITLTGSTPVEVELDGTYTELGATWTDTEDGSGSATVGGDTVDESTVGTYIVTYNYTDTDSNPASEVTRTVNVVDSGEQSIKAAGMSVNGNAGGYYYYNGNKVDFIPN